MGTKATVGTALYGFDEDELEGKRSAVVQVQGNPIRFNLSRGTPLPNSGGTPTGILGQVNSLWEFEGDEMNAFRAVRDESADAIIFVEFK